MIQVPKRQVKRAQTLDYVATSQDPYPPASRNAGNVDPWRE